jgi:S1-C subfamily serine protease
MKLNLFFIAIVLCITSSTALFILTFDFTFLLVNILLATSFIINRIKKMDSSIIIRQPFIKKPTVFKNKLSVRSTHKYYILGLISVLVVYIVGNIFYSNFTTAVATFKSIISTSSRDSVNSENSYLISAKKCTIPIIRDDEGHGTGFSTQKGFIITNKHVIEGSTSIYTILDGRNIELNIWNYSPLYDVAVLTISEDVATCDWADSSALGHAETLFAVGWPLSFEGDSTISKGVFSRYIDIGGDEYIQTDTTINQGNSGGPLLNINGIIGINTVKVAQEGVEGIGLALDGSYIQPIISRLIRDGSKDTEIPIGDYEYNDSSYNNGSEYESKPTIEYDTNNIDINTVATHRNSIVAAKQSWEYHSVESDDYNRMIDSFERQIIFCNTLIDNLNKREGRASNDDILMWDAIIKMSYESAALAKKLNGFYY